MDVKILLYIIIIPLSFIALDSIRIQNVFKEEHIFQARLLYMFLTLALSYLVVNCIYDMFLSTKFI